MQRNCPRAEGMVLGKKFVLPIESWFFTFFQIFFSSWFCMMLPLILTVMI
jgi:hypothetical protein